MAHALNYSATKFYTNEGQSYKMVVKIRLNDECKNNICDFSITGMVYEVLENARTREYIGGCIHNEILEQFPEFEPFVKLHLSDHYGSPMYPIANGMYWFNNDKYDVAKSELRLSDSEAETLCKIAKTEDKIYFQYALENLGITKRWQQEADIARKQLENLCCQKWENPYTPDIERHRLVPLTTEQLAELNKKIFAGYYSNEAIQARAEKAAQEKREKARAEIVARYNKDIQEAETSKAVMLAVFDFGINTDNVIYYNSSNKLSFNWKSYGERIPQETFIDFINNVDKSLLPEGIQFEYK